MGSPHFVSHLPIVPRPPTGWKARRQKMPEGIFMHPASLRALSLRPKTAIIKGGKVLSLRLQTGGQACPLR